VLLQRAQCAAWQILLCPNASERDTGSHHCQKVSVTRAGSATPSRADVQMTQAIIEVARLLGIAVHDHIIVGKDGHASLKALKLM
jgi:hypothetical protein